jgi:signal-transduction protein with cAMP-binding, CBS, and nucleotidyltransferase domain
MRALFFARQAALFLRQMPLFQRLNDNSVMQLALRLTARSYKRGDVISMADGEKELILIVEGPITEYDTSQGSGERRVVLQQLSANEFIGERSVLTGYDLYLTIYKPTDSLYHMTELVKHGPPIHLDSYRAITTS